jgi:spermidine/putrescine transport system ATP-binding protein
MPEVAELSPTVTLASDASHPAVALTGVSKRFGDVVAVNKVELEIKQNEFFSILGSSGCGKTTLLRMIAGFERPSTGDIYLDGQLVTGRSVRQRNLNLVFQSYALFPHLDVYNNVAFELKVRGGRRQEVDERVKETLHLVQLDGYERRKPAQLSGGQRQRVALARALIGQPAVLLLDEPLGALDQKLRKDMQIELKRLQREVGITFIYVTHDQEEALTMSDRIAVMRAGNLLQVDSPRRLYEAPNDTYVAGFVGQSNFLRGIVEEHAADGTIVGVDGIGCIRAELNRDAEVGAEVTVSFRPERARLGAALNGDNEASGTLREVVFVGNDTQYLVELAGGAMVQCRRQNDGAELDQGVGDQVRMTWSRAATVVLPS